MRLDIIRFIAFLTCLTTVDFTASAQSKSLPEILDFVQNNFTLEIDSSLKLCNDGIAIANRDGKLGAKARLLARRGVIYDIKGDVEKSVRDLLEAIVLQKELGDSSELSFCYNNLGISYFYRYRYDEALKNYLKSAKIDSARGDLKGWAGTMINVAIIESNQNKYHTALTRYNQILNLVDSIGYEGLYASIYSNRGKIHYKLKKFESTLKDLEKAQMYLQSSKDISPKMTLQVLLANTLLYLEKYGEALEAAKLGLELDEIQSYPERRMHLYESISHVYYALEKIDSADHYNDRYQELRDSLFNIETQSKVEEVRAKYQIAEKDKAYSELQLAESNQRNLAISRSKLAAEKEAERNLFIALAAISILIGAALFYRNRIKQNKEQILKAKIDLNEELLAQKEAMISEIHHRVKNNLQLVASMLALQARKVTDKQSKALFEASQSRLESMSLIHQNLYGKSDYEKVNILSYSRELCDQILTNYAPNLSINIQYDIEDMTLHIDTVVPLGLILNELLTNSIKYAFDEQKNAQIALIIREESDTLIMRYSDNGKGMQEERMGFGTQLIKSLARQLKSELIEPESNGYALELRIRKYERIE